MTQFVGAIATNALGERDAVIWERDSYGGEQ